MSSAELRERIMKPLLDEIEEAQYPSVAMLDRVEARLKGRDALADYAEKLIEKIEATRFPSIELLKRVDSVLERLEKAEREEAQQSH